MDRLRWAVRECLAFDGVPRTAGAIARVLGEPQQGVVRALRRLRRAGEVGCRGKGLQQVWYALEPLRIGGM